MQRHTRNEDAVRGENGESRLTAKTGGAGRKNVGFFVDAEIDDFTKYFCEKWWRVPPPTGAPVFFTPPRVRVYCEARAVRASPLYVRLRSSVLRRLDDGEV